MPQRDVVVIVNERGEVGIDGELLAAHVARLRELTGACVCCEGQAALVGALREFAATTPRPSRILVETSGAASPAGVIRALQSEALRASFRLDGVIAVVDVTRIAKALEFDLAAEQLGFADIVIGTHGDRLESIALGRAEDLIERYAPAAVLSHSQPTTPVEDLSTLLARRAETFDLPSSPSGHAQIEAVSLVHQGEFDEDRFGDWVESALGSAQSRILRLKGILAIHGIEERVIVQGVGESVEVSLGDPWREASRNSRLVVLGLGLDSSLLEHGFRECAWRDCPAS